MSVGLGQEWERDGVTLWVGGTLGQPGNSQLPPSPGRTLPPHPAQHQPCRALASWPRQSQARGTRVAPPPASGQRAKSSRPLWSGYDEKAPQREKCFWSAGVVEGGKRGTGARVPSERNRPGWADWKEGAESTESEERLLPLPPLRCLLSGTEAGRDTQRRLPAAVKPPRPAAPAGASASLTFRGGRGGGGGKGFECVGGMPR